MSDGNHDNLVRAIAIDDSVGEARHEQPAGLLVGGHWVPGVRVRRQSINRLGDLVQQLTPETTAPALVPANRLAEFDGRL
jgi:hypothetical protein